MLAILTSIAVPALGNLFSRSHTKSTATLFQDDLRQARYESRSRSNEIITFCAIASKVKNKLINCSTVQGYKYGWLWYTGTGSNAILLGKNYAVSENSITVTPLINFLIEFQKTRVTLWDKDDAGTRSVIPVPYGTPATTYPSVTFSDSSNRSSVVVFDETGRTSLKHH